MIPLDPAVLQQLQEKAQTISYRLVSNALRRLAGGRPCAITEADVQPIPEDMAELMELATLSYRLALSTPCEKCETRQRDVKNLRDTLNVADASKDAWADRAVELSKEVAQLRLALSTSQEMICEALNIARQHSQQPDPALSSLVQRLQESAESLERLVSVAPSGWNRDQALRDAKLLRQAADALKEKKNG